MGREVRRVPSHWKHPKDENGFIPLLEGGFLKALKEWEEEKDQWEKGFRLDYTKDGRQYKPKDPDDTGTYEDWAGKKPEEKEYMPDWGENEKTHIQMYETCTEGTPISPVMETPEELAKWLADNKASAFGDITATYEEWLSTILRGWSCSMVYSPETGLIPGVLALHKRKEEN